VAVGNYITVADCGTAVISAVTNTTVATLSSGITDGAGKVYHTSSAPKWADTTSEISSSTLYGVDATEQSVIRAAANSTVSSPTHAGWVQRTDRGSARTPRYRYETLVAMGSMSGDAEDTVFADA
jgi:glucose dehydrogenase